MQAVYLWLLIQGDQKVSVHLMISIQSGAQRLFDHPVQSLVDVVSFLVWRMIYAFSEINCVIVGYNKNNERCTVRVLK